MCVSSARLVTGLGNVSDSRPVPQAPYTPWQNEPLNRAHRTKIERMNFFTHSHLLAIAILLSLSYPLTAANNQEAVCSSDPSSALIFVGTLTDWTAVGAPPQWNLATFRVGELLQGEGLDEVSVLMINNLCEKSGTKPTIGRTYLVFAGVWSKGSERHVSQLEHCGQVRPIEQATADLEYLRSSQRGTTSTQVSGEAVVEPRGYPWKTIPLPEIKIHLVGPERRFDFVSDDNGHFQGPLTPGKYAITTEFPTGYEENSPHPPITVTEHRCTQLSIDAIPTSSITAHIVDVNGTALRPMSNVQLTLETADDQQFVQSVWPDENSNLKADHLLPGRYVLGLNTYLPVNRGSAPYPPIYFPGVRTRSEAQVITLNTGEQKILSEMRIKEGKQCEIPVLVRDSLGHPIGAAVVGIAYGDYPHFYIEPREQTDDKGRETVYAVFPGPVLLRAEKDRQDGSRIESERLEVDSCPSQAISLRLTRVAVDRPEPNEK